MDNKTRLMLEMLEAAAGDFEKLAARINNPRDAIYAKRAELSVRALLANLDNIPHASDCAVWVGENCECVIGKQ